MRFVIAADKFKDCLTAAEVAAALSVGIREVQPAALIEVVPVADGGEGTVDALVAAGFSPRTAMVTGPTGSPVEATFAVSGRTALVEMAQASGLSRLPGGVRAALTASTFGTGELLAAAIASGCDQVMVGLGGSATTDGGTGMLRALGYRFLDRRGQELPLGGAALSELASIDDSNALPALGTVVFVAASDVTVPLTGPTGAASMFGPQKGASPADVILLERALTRLSVVAARHLGVDRSSTPGAGAAGGTGFALLAFLRATMQPGIEVVLDAANFDDLARSADVIITGEGAVDAQTLQGKAPVGVARRAHKVAPAARVVLVGGRVDCSAEDLDAAGFSDAYALADVADGLDTFTQAAELLRRVGRRFATGAA